MEDLFALEEFQEPEFMAPQVQQHQDIVLQDIKSHPDPVLIKDKRILSNILQRQGEYKHTKQSYFESVQTEIKPHMRKIVSDWMLEVTEEQQCQPEVFSLAIDYLDRFLSVVNIKKSQFQLLACVCLFLASKFKETAPLPAENLVIYTDSSVSTFEITVRFSEIFFFLLIKLLSTL